jgi:hypothetical protein
MPTTSAGVIILADFDAAMPMIASEKEFEVLKTIQRSRYVEGATMAVNGGVKTGHAAA